MKMYKNLLVLLVLSLLLVSCAKQAAGELPTPQVLVSAAPEVDASVESFLTLWEKKDYGQMYEMISASSKQEISDTDFVNFYEQTASNATLQSIETQLLSSMKNPNSATAKYRVVFNTFFFESFDREIDMALTLEENTWRVNWNPGLFLPELAEGNRLQLE
ncbi:MAG: hypothetical protein MUO76_02670, partial [Anaerolineaceae bacterium]|nr:hypothetical protein [Anaerolineaceae bacterium]